MFLLGLGFLFCWEKPHPVFRSCEGPEPLAMGWGGLGKLPRKDGAWVLNCVQVLALPSLFEGGIWSEVFSLLSLPFLICKLGTTVPMSQERWEGRMS